MRVGDIIQDLGYYRVLSSDQSQIQGASFRALRFQSSSSTTSLYSKARSGIIRVLGGLERSLSPPRTVQKSSSTNSLGLMTGLRYYSQNPCPRHLRL